MLTLIIQKAYCIAAVFLLCYCTVLLKQFEVTASQYILSVLHPIRGTHQDLRSVCPTSDPLGLNVSLPSSLLTPPPLFFLNHFSHSLSLLKTNFFPVQFLFHLGRNLSIDCVVQVPHVKILFNQGVEVSKQ